MQAQSILSLEDFTESRSLRPRKQQQHYDFDFSAGEESDGDPERLALDEEPDTQVAHRSLDVLAGQKVSHFQGVLQGSVLINMHHQPFAPRMFYVHHRRIERWKLTMRFRSLPPVDPPATSPSSGCRGR